jgi:Spy/CpxP family protein refolding chaperone
MLENIDEAAYFEESIRQLQTTDLEAYNQILSILTTEEQQSLETNLTQAKKAFVRQLEQRQQRLIAGN